ncbi:hypothetical protein BASA50_006812 [Batrachochytrium salamandrivorans]|uniref:Presequence translocated-associated motor subunit PAM17 n=1 Tax=Batrachochytrium salamandrivorans TaxID=1357716 RepID=A0ABQ8FBT4_9FUNG|nr:hypothetical protein BASA60_007081 [Batrachochytrium salamandrivorans]KAH6574663.1 hypothetical protein BASA62_002349 [Batrachochytrium salamandrivorans]KAH6594222.1 hypothetical protein BASA50_006812 [Batrachochytrium salamandrivorans]KAH9252014.1 hypothetical protein BASA81_010108 [Batrachochytrium salamandrivorans]KAJ1328815.1 hypothetical protein BSLG_009902 [Batrachochytrium salamandrivorans]
MLSQILLRRLIVASPVRTLSIRAAAAPKLPNLQTVSWTEFFALRKSRRLVERSSGLVGGLLGLTLGSYYFVFVAEFDPFTPIWGMDPSMPYMMAAMSVSVAATVAANLGSTQLWRAMRSPEILRAFDLREKEFHMRILRHRPKDLPLFTTASPTRPPTPPDYYGERIYSFSDYRKWIRQQRKFIAATTPPSSQL